jgi:signal transduction histidine kinase
MILTCRKDLCFRYLPFILGLLFFTTPKTTSAAAKLQTFDDYNQLIIKYRFSMPDSGIYYARRALAFCRKNNDLKGQAMILNHWGIIDENQGRFDEGRKKYLLAIEAYRKISFTEGIGDETIRLGVTEMRRANFDKAIGYFLEALKIHEENQTPRGIMECYDVLGEAYMGQSNWETALSYLLKGERLSRKLPFSGITLYIYNNIGVTYTALGDTQKAMAYLQKGVKLSNEQQYAGLHVTLLNSMAMVYTKMGKRQKAISLQLNALQQARNIKNYLRELQTLNGLADNYAAQNPDKALAYLKQALILSHQKNAGKVRMETLNRMAKLYEQKGNYADALKITKQQHALADSIFNLAKVTEIANLQSNYQLHRSRTDVERLQFSNREQKNRQLIIIFITLSVGLLAVVLGYYNIRTNYFNKQLSKLNADLKASNAVKDKIFSVIGHDLRAPLATVRNFLYVLDDDSLTKPEKEEIIQELIATCDASLGVLNQLLNWGQMQIKGVLLNPTTFTADNIIDNNLLLFNNAFKEKRLSLSRQLTPNLRLYADADHIDFVMRNLISNAVKFTPDGGTITIGNNHVQADGFVAFYVTDTGVGMDAETAGHIFERNNVSTEGTRGEKGTSLGLLMCKEYVEANGGTISVSSLKGQGSTFTFTVKTVNYPK